MLRRKVVKTNMYGIRKDGLAERLITVPYPNEREAIEHARMCNYLAVLYKKKYVYENTKMFIKNHGELKVLKNIPQKAKLFRSNDPEV